ncbi:CAMK/CAMKL/MARK protein kinase [Corchorus olitorius]|uniref:CAMK/CAMKL/MARK protein kinase n=1 Tax=Corchorus olitorius TaxID=93759 RepID=A0A1R3GTY5_9ROSI|nr:CAMK/CAMKL/MARK protein kinase [Corchorus olitorius]
MDFEVASKKKKKAAKILRNQHKFGYFGMVKLPTAPKRVRGWTRMSDIWDLPKDEQKVVKSKFAFKKLDSEEFVDEETIERIKTRALEDVCGKWRAWKNELKSKYYDEDSTLEN